MNKSPLGSRTAELAELEIDRHVSGTTICIDVREYKTSGVLIGA